MASLFIRSPIPVYEKELVFPCCQKEDADELIEKINLTTASPAKNRSSTSVTADEETKSDGQTSSAKEEGTSCSSFLGENVTNDELAGVCTAWFLKCPPIDGNSHFENLQSTNWNSLRFKNPPTEDSDIGWRVEFRPMDIQLTDFENTALTVCVGMIANVINTFNLDFVLPVSLIDENMKRAHDRDGLLSTKFWWKIPASSEPSITQQANLQES